jgi:amidase
MSTDPEAWHVGAVLDGVPRGRRLGVKDNIDLAGYPTAVGSRVLAQRTSTAHRDAAVVALLRSAGFVPVAKTTLVELAYGTHGVNPFYGTPSNALDAELVPGGSSSGSAVGVAIGALDLALGTDTGGSVRIPAACNGILGLKAGWAARGLAGVAPLAPSLDSIGLLASDPGVLAVGISALGIGNDGWAAEGVAVVDIDAADTVERIGELAPGAPRAPVDVAELARIGGIVLDAEAAATWSWLLEEGHRLDPWVRERLAAARGVGPSAYLAARRALWEERRRIGEWFRREHRALLAPTLAVPPPRLVDWASARLNPLTIPFNVLGLAVLSVPVGGGKGAWAHSRVPLSVQLAGPAGSEGELLALAGRLGLL